VTQTAQEMGITASLESVPAEGIGGLAEGVTPLEMADAYATLANGGVHHDPTAISKVEFPNGKVDEADNESGQRVLTPGEAYEVTRVLEGVITSGTGAGYTSTACISAGKTGTSEEESDAWFVGYTPRFSTAVWVGHPQSREYTGYGGPTAGPIWQSYMESAQEGECEEFEAPESLPELSELDSEHTSSSGYSDEYEESPYEYEAEEESEDEGEEKGDGGDEGGAEAGQEATPTPTPTPSPTPSAPPSGGGISPG
jgi:penicillin-binding protein 1A